MRAKQLPTAIVLGCMMLLAANVVSAQDWPQWRGPNRDNKVTGFTVPKTWPKELTKQWNVKVGEGDAGPVLAGDKVYLFTRQGDDEVTLCLDAKSGKELWRDKYAAEAVGGTASGHPGPRATPAVGDGKVCTFGVGGVLSCLDAASGKIVWRKETKGKPGFYTAASPMILEGNCIAYIGGKGNGEIVGYDLSSGAEKWKWKGEGPAYGSPVLMTLDGAKQLVTLTSSSLIGIGVGSGKELWRVKFAARYNSGTPIVEGTTVFCGGPEEGTVALRIEKKGDGLEATPIWKKAETPPGIYNTPLLKDGRLYGITTGGGGKKGGGKGKGTGFFYCMNAKTGEEVWTDKTPRGDCGAIYDVGPVLLGLSSDSYLVAFEPGTKTYSELAKYKVADSPTWAPPIIAGNRIYVKDRATLTLWTIE